MAERAKITYEYFENGPSMLGDVICNFELAGRKWWCQVGFWPSPMPTACAPNYYGFGFIRFLHVVCDAEGIEASIHSNWCVGDRALAMRARQFVVDRYNLVDPSRWGKGADAEPPAWALANE